MSKLSIFSRLRLMTLSLFWRFLSSPSKRVIGCPHQLKQYLISRIPGIGTFSIPVGQKLFVDEDQIAILSQNGVLFDIIKPGLHEINPEKTPLLFTSAFVSGKNIRGIQVFFVSIRNTRHKWGTPNQSLIEVTGSKPVLIRAYGSYSIDVADINKLIDLAKSCQDYVFDDVHGHLRGILVNSFARVLIKHGAKKGKSVSELLTDSDSVGQKMLFDCKESFLAVGVNLNSVSVEGLSLSDESLAQILGVEQDVFSRSDEMRNMVRQMGEEIEERETGLEDRIAIIDRELKIHRIVQAVLVLVLGLLAIFVLPSMLPLHWLLSHPHKIGIQIGLTIVLLGFSWILVDTSKTRRTIVTTSIIIGMIITLIGMI